MQVPIIMGVLGNNAKNVMAATTGDNRVTNEQPGSLAVSGYAEGQIQRLDQQKKLHQTKIWQSLDQMYQRSAPPPKGVKLNKFGLRPDKPLTSQQLKDAQNARATADQQGLTGQEREDFVMKSVADGIERRTNIANSPATPANALPYNEGPDVQQINAADVKNDDEMEQKTVMAKPDDPVQSAMKAIQTIIENMTAKVDKYLNAIQSYVDAVSSGAEELQKFIHDAACQMTKYMKVIFDKIMEFVH